MHTAENFGIFSPAKTDSVNHEVWYMEDKADDIVVTGALGFMLGRKMNLAYRRHVELEVRDDSREIDVTSLLGVVKEMIADVSYELHVEGIEPSMSYLHDLMVSTAILNKVKEGSLIDVRFGNSGFSFLSGEAALLARDIAISTLNAEVSVTPDQQTHDDQGWTPIHTKGVVVAWCGVFNGVVVTVTTKGQYCMIKSDGEMTIGSKDSAREAQEFCKG